MDAENGVRDVRAWLGTSAGSGGERIEGKLEC